MSSKMFLQGTEPSFWRTLLSISLLVAACPPPTTPGRGNTPKSTPKTGRRWLLGVLSSAGRAGLDFMLGFVFMLIALPL